LSDDQAMLAFSFEFTLDKKRQSFFFRQLRKMNKLTARQNRVQQSVLCRGQKKQVDFSIRFFQKFKQAVCGRLLMSSGIKDK